MISLHKYGKSPNPVSEDPLQAVGLLLLAVSYKALVQAQEVPHLSREPSPTFQLSSNARLPYNCITGYATGNATTPPSILYNGAKN